MLDIRKEEALSMLILGSGPTEIAKKINVSRNAIYNWKLDPEFIEELETRRKDIVSQANNYVYSKVVTNLEKIQKLADNTKDSRTAAQCLQYLTDKCIGKTATRITSTENNDNNIIVTLLDSE